MKPLNLLIGLSALLAMLNLSGCIVVPDDDGYRHEHRYRYEHDYHDHDGRRDDRWCYDHPNSCGFQQY